MRLPPTITSASAALCAFLREIDGEAMAMHADWVEKADNATMLACCIDDAALACAAAAWARRARPMRDDRDAEVVESSAYAAARVAAELLAAAVRAAYARGEEENADRLAREAMRWLGAAPPKRRCPTCNGVETAVESSRSAPSTRPKSRSKAAAP